MKQDTLKKERQKIYALNDKFREKIEIVFNCGHAGRKVNHHPDYSSPFQIHRLCKSCHSKVHPKINKAVRRIKMEEKELRERTTLTITPSVSAQIKACAEAENRSFSNMVEKILVEYLKDHQEAA